LCYDEQGDFAAARCNTASVDLEPLATMRCRRGARPARNARDHRQPARRKWILEQLGASAAAFIKVFPHEYKRVLAFARRNGLFSSHNFVARVAAAEVHHG
jgi:glutamate synthase (NADPH/NADH) large chain